jgi:putative tricarboxylic transport membrane protein
MSAAPRPSGPALDLLRAPFQRNEFLAGLFVLLLGGLCLAAVGDLEIGNSTEMGPGYVPRALAWFLVVSGAGLAAAGARQAAPARAALHWRPVLMVSLSVLSFGATVDRWGIVVAVLLSTVLATLASPISRHRETPWLCLLLVLLASLGFVKGLGLAIPIWPR